MILAQINFPPDRSVSLCIYIYIYIFKFYFLSEITRKRGRVKFLNPGLIQIVSKPQETDEIPIAVIP